MEAPRLALAELFPGDEDVQFFGRKELPKEKWKSAKNAEALWVSRDGAWPEALKNDKAWVWTAGLDTWKKLARRGIWVHGSSEGLGESEDPRIEWLISNTDQPRPLKWTKLSHLAAEDYQELQMDMIYTYQLQPLSPKIFWQGKKAAYWKSASSFDQAVKLGAPVQSLRHASGPGLTHQYLVRRLKELGVHTTPEIYLDREQWREVMTGKKG
jgi:hydroxymethylbilane synthase